MPPWIFGVDQGKGEGPRMGMRKRGGEWTWIIMMGNVQYLAKESSREEDEQNGL